MVAYPPSLTANPVWLDLRQLYALLWQHTLADFIHDGHFWRHLKKMRQHYTQRRLWIEKALKEQGFVVTLQKGGIQLVIEIEGDDKAQVAKANQAGLAVQALSRWRIASTGKGGILLSFTNITSAEMAE
ncbi:DeoR family transcriptional regulator [Salmonella bongori]|nr:DeoR family transcriptional regulator [Salmonella bongori]